MRRDASPHAFMNHIRPALPRGRIYSLASNNVKLKACYATVKPQLHWTKERLQTNADYPLSLQLSTVFKPWNPPSRREPPARKSSDESVAHGKNNYMKSQIVSPGLCDDVIKYIAPTLEKHKGCDILDINPGAGLWSQKLHEHLRPRRHVLVEARYDMFKSFLDPLLSAPGSQYVLTEKDPCNFSTYKEIIEEGFFPDQTRYDPNDPRAQQPNHSMLVIGSLAWDPKLPGFGFDSMAKQLYNAFVTAAWSNELFHAFGPVRTMLWAQHDEFDAVTAKSVSGLLKANAHLEMLSDATLIVCPTVTKRKLGRAAIAREPQYELESTVRALQSARKNGFHLPSHRVSQSVECAEEIERVTDGTGKTRSDDMQIYLRERIMEGKSVTGLAMDSVVGFYLEEKKLQAKFPEIDLSPAGEKKARYEDHPAKKEYFAFTKLRRPTLHALKAKAKIEAIADLGEELYELECQLLRLPEGQDRDNLIKKAEALESALLERAGKLPANFGSAPFAEIDDRFIMRSTPSPRLQWDRRPFEPLVMQPDEAWPSSGLQLISAEPRPRPMPMTDDPDWHEWLQDFVYGIFAWPSKGLPDALDRMQHGLSGIIDECPSLKNPDKGGRWNMRQLRVRVLTEEMITELAAAYRRWPFKAPHTDHKKYFRQNAFGA